MAIKEIESSGYERIVLCNDHSLNFDAVIVIHNTNRGKICLGGCRMYPYSDNDEMVEDAKKLSEKMTYKNALSELNFGGSKCVIRGDPQKDKNERILLGMADFINYFNNTGMGKLVYTGQDVGISASDVEIMSKRTNYLVGLKNKSGDPAIPTALGVFYGINSAAKEIFNKPSIEGLTIGIYGLGNVGFNLVKHLCKEKCTLIAFEKNRNENLFFAEKNCNVKFVSEEEFFNTGYHVFSPNVPGVNVSGGALDDKKLDSLYQKKLSKDLIIAGSTNTPLLNSSLMEKINSFEGMYLIPPEIINAGGVISVASDLTGETSEQVNGKIKKIGVRVAELISCSRTKKKPLNEVTKEIAFKKVYS